MRAILLLLFTFALMGQRDPILVPEVSQHEVQVRRPVGGQHARRLFYTGARIDGREAAAIGLADECVDDAAAVRARSLELTAEIAASAPLVVQAVKRTLAGDRLDRLRAATDHELAEQVRLLATDDAREGIAAYAERRPPKFHAR